jgi:hypothetical protein
MNPPTATVKLAGVGESRLMTPYSSKVTIRAKWFRGWALMRAGKTSEGYDLLSGIKLSDLKWVADAERPEQIFARVKSIINREPPGEADENRAVMEVLIRAAKRGDREASELLVFGDLGELSEATS